MKKNKILYVILTIVVLVFAIVGLTVGIVFADLYSKNKKNNELSQDSITRYEWIQMLCEQFGTTNYSQNEPYFKDVNEDNEYFLYVQSAVEWNIIDKETKFNGQKLASGKFVALTSMKAIGKYKIQLYLESFDNITNSQYLNLAYEKNIISKNDRNKHFNYDQCKSILDKVSNLYTNELINDDYEKVVYKDDVKDLSNAQILNYNTDYSEMEISKEYLDQIKIGDIIILTDENNFKFAKKVNSIDKNGRLFLADVELGDAVESLAVSETENVSFKNIYDYYSNNADYSVSYNNIDNNRMQRNSLYDNDTEHLYMNYQSELNTYNNTYISKNLNKEIDTKGFSIGLEKKEDEEKMQVTICDNDTGITLKSPDIKFEGDDQIIGSINVNKIDIKTQAVYNFPNVEYVNISVDTNTKFTGTFVSAENKNKTYELMSIPMPIGSGVAVIELKAYLVFDIKGEVSITFDIPSKLCITYENGKGIRNHKFDVSIKNPSLEIACEIETGIRIEPALSILKFHIIDLESDFLASAKIKITARAGNQSCTDISVSCPVVKLGILKDENIDSFLKKFVSEADITVISSENAPFKRNLHYEIYKDGSGKFVKKCTLEEDTVIEESTTIDEAGNSQKQENQNNNIMDKYAHNYPYSNFPFDLKIAFTSAFKENKGYYTATAKLYYQDSIMQDDFLELNDGEHFTVGDHEYIKIKEIEDTTSRLNYELLGVFDGQSYCILNTMSPNINSQGDFYYKIYDDELWLPVYTTLEKGDYEVKIPFGTEIEIATSQNVSTDRMYTKYSARECYDESIADFNGDVLTTHKVKYGDMFGSVKFDDAGGDIFYFREESMID